MTSQRRAPARRSRITWVAPGPRPRARRPVAVRRELRRQRRRGRRPLRSLPDDLDESAGEDWPTVGGSFANDRYSTLDEITTENVADLRGVWKRDLRDSGTEAKYSGESQPVVFDGVIYVTTGKNDVFAVEVETGSIIWQYEADLNQDISTVCCGWLNRGVAIGDGRVYQGQLDGKVVALDAKTGEKIWTRQLVRWQEGQTITAAPIFADGRIYLGVVGADLGTRGFLEAMDAETGKVGLAVLHDPRARAARRRLVAEEQRRVPAGRRRDLAGAGVRPGARAPLLLDRQRGARLGRQRPPGRQQVDGVDRRRRGGDGEVPLGLPDGPSRHLGPRRGEPRRPLRRLRRPQGRGPGRQDGMALHARPRDGEAPVRHRREAGAPGPAPAHREDAADPAQRRVHPARARVAKGGRRGSRSR